MMTNSPTSLACNHGNRYTKSVRALLAPDRFAASPLKNRENAARFTTSQSARHKVRQQPHYMPTPMTIRVGTGRLAPLLQRPEELKMISFKKHSKTSH